MAKRYGRMWLAGLLLGCTISNADATGADQITRLIQAASQGASEAAYELGTLYGSGDGVTRSYARANQYYEQAAKAGYAPAQNNLGWAYREGLGMAKDPQQAIYWFRKSALQGNALALQNLGEMFRDGEGVAQDGNQTTLLFSLCAAQPLNQPGSEGSFDNAVLGCRLDLGKNELAQARTMDEVRRAVFLLLLAQQPNKDLRTGRGVGYERAIKTMGEAKALYNKAYPRLDAQAAEWVRTAMANQDALMALLREKTPRPAVLR